MCSAERHVRFTPESGHVQCKEGCPLWVKSGHVQREDVRFTPKSGHVRCNGDFRFGPKADIETNLDCQLFNHLVGRH